MLVVLVPPWLGAPGNTLLPHRLEDAPFLADPTTIFDSIRRDREPLPLTMSDRADAIATPGGRFDKVREFTKRTDNGDIVNQETLRMDGDWGEPTNLVPATLSLSLPPSPPALSTCSVQLLPAEILSWVGVGFASFFFLSPMGVMLRVVRKRDVAGFSVVPYLASFLCCSMWVIYSMPSVTPCKSQVKPEAIQTQARCPLQP